jgi:predicted nucleotidyltransferase
MLKEGLKGVVGSRALAQLIVHFAVHPDEPMHFRALQRHTGLGNRSLQQQLEKLVGWGVVARDAERGAPRYRADSSSPRWASLRALVRSFADPAEVLSEALAGVSGIDAAFVFGSSARGEARADSDVDLFILGDAISTATLGRATATAALLLNRELDVKRFTRAKLHRVLTSSDPGFAASALRGPKQWVVGSDSTLAGVA